ncbi:hypothetical protein DB30_02876 [Enhygromyxa salina]|uniref:Uncharacterized protein n=1 Tax=Enhygromyxa salina TaxID=215803 RepID=A0A0C2CUV9_9BACT|nr:hypothetical protein DB30_02876 [Enhygromyxa salina]
MESAGGGGRSIRRLSEYFQLGRATLAGARACDPSAGALADNCALHRLVRVRV